MPKERSALPELKVSAWKPTRDALHAYAQVAGSIRAAFSPHEKHWFHVSLRTTARGLTTMPVPARNGTLKYRSSSRPRVGALISATVAAGTLHCAASRRRNCSRNGTGASRHRAHCEGEAGRVRACRMARLRPRSGHRYWRVFPGSISSSSASRPRNTRRPLQYRSGRTTSTSRCCCARDVRSRRLIIAIRMSATSSSTSVSCPAMMASAKRILCDRLSRSDETHEDTLTTRRLLAYARLGRRSDAIRGAAACARTRKEAATVLSRVCRLERISAEG